MSDVARFYKLCLRKAANGVFWRAEKWAGAVALLALLVSRFIPMPEAWTNIIAVDLPLYFFLVVIFSIGLIRVVMAPVEVWKDERDKKLALEQRLEPSLRVFLDETDGTRLMFGTTSETHGGRRQSAILNDYDTVVRLACENTGEQRLKNVRAKVVRAVRTKGEGLGPLPMTTPIELPWDPRKLEDSHSIDIDPGERQDFWVGWVRPQGQFFVMREANSLPMGYQQYFGDEGTYEISIEVSSDTLRARGMRIQVVAEPADPPNPGFYRAGGKAQVSILEWG